jgi:hypothetical protein
MMTSGAGAIGTRRLAWTLRIVALAAFVLAVPISDELMKLFIRVAYWQLVPPALDIAVQFLLYDSLARLLRIAGAGRWVRVAVRVVMWTAVAGRLIDYTLGFLGDAPDPITAILERIPAAVYGPARFVRPASVLLAIPLAFIARRLIHRAAAHQTLSDR